MIELNFFIKKDSMIRTDSHGSLTAGNENYYQCKFKFFGRDWSGRVKTLVCFHSEHREAQHIILDERGSCVLPPSVINTPGHIILGVFGNADTQRLATNVISIPIMGGSATIPPAPRLDVYEQIMVLIQRLINEGGGGQGMQGPAGPKGETGDTGPEGAQGPKGDTGAQGQQGEQGAAGAKGSKGDTGAIGPAGPKGETGEPGGGAGMEADKYLYVDLSDGDDGTGDGTQENPYKTLQRAIDDFPRQMNGYTAHIYVESQASEPLDPYSQNRVGIEKTGGTVNITIGYIDFGYVDPWDSIYNAIGLMRLVVDGAVDVFLNVNSQDGHAFSGIEAKNRANVYSNYQELVNVLGDSYGVVASNDSSIVFEDSVVFANYYTGAAAMLSGALSQQADHETRIRTLESKGGRRWEGLVTQVITLGVAAFIGWLLAGGGA